MKFLILLHILLFNICLYAQSKPKVKVAKAYIIQEIACYGLDFYPPFKGCYRLQTHGEFYVATRHDIMNFIKDDTVVFNNLTLLIANQSIWYPKIIGNYDSNKILDFLVNKNSEIYIINDKFYLIKKIRYKYIDNIELHTTKGKYINTYVSYTDNIDEDEEDTSYINLKQCFNIDYFQILFKVSHEMQTNKKINKYVWKRREDTNW
ncbi:MAG: hypothetical protein ACOXZH_01595 [Bacteroidales bacterium]|jgi:hypothetical protein